MLTIWRIGIVFVVLFAGVAHSKENPNSETTETKKAPDNEQRGSNNNPITVKILPSPDADTKAAKEEHYREEKASEDKWLTRSTVWLAFVTTPLAVFTALLWIATWRLVKGAEDTAKRQLRAYVSVASAEIIDLNAGLIPVAHLRVKNFGQTPAYDLVAIGGIAVGESFDRLPAPTGPSVMSRSSLSIGAISDQYHPAPRPLRPEEMAAILAGTMTLWVYGEFQYRDTFNINHSISYRFQTGGTAGVRGTNLAVCEEGNQET